MKGKAALGYILTRFMSVYLSVAIYKGLVRAAIGIEEVVEGEEDKISYTRHGIRTGAAGGLVVRRDGWMDKYLY